MSKHASKKHYEPSSPKKPTKPPDCTCGYPIAVAQNPTGHAPNCQAYKRIQAEIYDVRQKPPDDGKRQWPL